MFFQDVNLFFQPTQTQVHSYLLLVRLDTKGSTLNSVFGWVELELGNGSLTEVGLRIRSLVGGHGS